MSDSPDTTVIERELTSAGHAHVAVHGFAELASTSVWLRELKSEVVLHAPVVDYVSPATSPQTHVCVTHWQNAGIARRGRTWQTKPGNITFSILSNTRTPTKELLGLSLVTGIGVANALADSAGVQVQLKWPNDIILNDSKLGGLLTEIFANAQEGGGHSGSQILTGIGINYLHDEEVLALGIGATSLESAGVAVQPGYRDLLVGKLAASVLSAHEQFYAEGWAPFAARWRSLDWLVDKAVNLHAEDSTQAAVARGVNEHGALLVERAGRTMPLYSGNVSVRPAR